jgi:hypothetical protein
MHLSMAGLQGFLISSKSRPFGAVVDIGGWVERGEPERDEVEKGHGRPLSFLLGVFFNHVQ